MLHATIDWTGFPGAPGFTNLYFLGGLTQSEVDAVNGYLQTFTDNLHFFVPSNVTLQARQQVEEIDPGAGTLLGVLNSTTAPSAWTGAVTGLYSAPSGAVINWQTPGIHAGRRVRGRTFVVPLGGTQYDSSGTLLAGAVTGINAAATALNASTLGVWARPRPGVPGAIYNTTGNSVPDKACVLRSRRD